MALLWVALLAEGVDRNSKAFITASNKTRSPSSRRAWIEICHALLAAASAEVALLAEGVDRNQRGDELLGFTKVALLAEGVDRNQSSQALHHLPGCRPPRGGRG